MVLPTTMPSTRCRRAAPTTSSSSLSERSGAILISTGVVPALRLMRARASITRDSSSSKHLALLQVAQARRIGRGNVAGEIARDRREHFDLTHVVVDAVGRILVGADIDADDAALIGARGEPGQHRIGALAVEAEPIDHGLVGIETEQARARIAGLRPAASPCRSRQTRSRPAAARRAPRHACRSPAPCRRDWGKLSPKARTASRASSAAGRRQRRQLQRFDREAVRALGRRAAP